MSTFYLPFISKADVKLKVLFAVREIAFGMAGEAISFASSVQGPIVRKHCALFSSEVSVKMDFTQPEPGRFSFDDIDSLSDYCEAAGIRLHGHCVIWHSQYPGWLDQALLQLSDAGRYGLMAEHIRQVVGSLSDRCASLDLLNEYQPACEAGVPGFGYYLGLDGGRFAFEEARKVSGGCKLFYNSFFRTDADANYAISLLDVSDGIGVQLHLNTWWDLTDLFARVVRMAEACGRAGKEMRFAEVSVQGDDMQEVAQVYRQTVRLALDLAGVVQEYVTWGVKGSAWNGGKLLFDTYGKENEAYYAVVEELSR